MEPYYEHGGITIYHGDCRLVVPQLPPVDLLLTDPPYGINENVKKQKSRQGHGLAAQRDYGDYDWDGKPPEAWLIEMIRHRCQHQIIFGGNYFTLPPVSCWLVWDKDNGDTDFADCELAWTNLPKAVRRLKWKWQGMLQENMGAAKEAKFHPTQKPLAVMKWCIGQAPDDCATILDPFAGSCTTARAAKDLGRKCICIEQDERYCEIGANRLRQEVLF